jgi:ribosomal protein L37AE/L43A
MTKYKCNQCGAEDSDRTSSAPLALICWKCRAGKDNKSYTAQLDSREGMFQIDASGNYAWETK